MANENPVASQVFNVETETLLPLTPANPAGHLQPITLTMQRGTEVTTFEDGNTSERLRFRGVWEAHEGKLAASGKGAVTGLLNVANYGKTDDFVFDTDAEFFKVAAKTNVEKNPVTDEIKAELTAANASLVEAQDAEGNAQVAFRDAGKALNAVFEKIGGKALAKWFGTDEAKKLVPALIALNNTGKNALSDFRSFGKLSDAVFARLPVGITQGKVADNFIREVLSDVLENAGVTLLRENAKMDDQLLIEVDYLEVAARAVIDSTGVEKAYNTVSEGLTLLGNMLDEGTFGERGRHATRAAVLIEDISAAVTAANAFIAVSDDVADGKDVDDKTIEKVRTDYRKCIFVKRVSAAALAASKKRADESRAASVMKAADKEANDKLDAKTKLKDRAASDVAAQVFNTIKGHASLKEIYRDLGILVNDYLKAVEVEAAKEAAE